jgi:hypothetical protein
MPATKAWVEMGLQNSREFCVDYNTRDLQPVASVPPGAREDVLGGTRKKTFYINPKETQEPLES